MKGRSLEHLKNLQSMQDHLIRLSDCSSEQGLMFGTEPILRSLIAAASVAFPCLPPGPNDWCMKYDTNSPIDREDVRTHLSWLHTLDLPPDMHVSAFYKGMDKWQTPTMRNKNGVYVLTDKHPYKLAECNLQAMVLAVGTPDNPPWQLPGNCKWVTLENLIAAADEQCAHYVDRRNLQCCRHLMKIG